MRTTYLRPADELVTHELEIKRSRFITWIARAEDEDAARGLIARAREEYPDARHHCSAFIVHVDGALPVERSSDDGEPSGTAGRPMLEVLKGSELLDIAAVVVRYFGGVKLGTGGLVSAYTEAVSGALASVRRVERSMKDLLTVDLPHAEAGRIEAELRARGIDVVGVEYGSLARYTLACDPGEHFLIDDTLAALTQGTASTRAAGHEWVESPL